MFRSAHDVAVNALQRVFSQAPSEQLLSAARCFGVEPLETVALVEADWRARLASFSALRSVAGHADAAAYSVAVHAALARLLPGQIARAEELAERHAPYLAREVLEQALGEHQYALLKERVEQLLAGQGQQPRRRVA